MHHVSTSAPSGHPSLRARVALVVLLAFSALALQASPASAHSGMTGSDPADGSTVDVAPDRIVLSFNEAPQTLGSEIVVLGPDGSVVSQGVTTIADVDVTQTLATSRPAGTYVIQWRVTSADGHPLSGQLVFTATTGTGEPEPAAPEGLEPTRSAPTPAEESATPTPASNTTEGRAADEEQVAWRWGPTSIVALVVIAIAVGGLIVVAWRLRRQAFGARDEDEDESQR